MEWLYHCVGKRKLMSTNHLQVAVAADANYAGIASIFLISLFENNKEFNKITVHLLSNAIPVSVLDIIRQSVLEGKGELIVHDVSDLQERLGIDIPPTISISAYSRLFLSSILSNEIEKVLYMDVDAVVEGSLYALWSMNMGDYQVGGVLDDVSSYAKEKVGLNAESPYLNSGFLLVNLQKWREEYIEEKMLHYLAEHHGNVYPHDQGLINAVCNRKLILPVNYNMVTNFFVFPYRSLRQVSFYTRDEIEEGKSHPVFIHFTAGVANRPWVRGCRHPLKNVFLKYRAKSVYRNQPLIRDNRPEKLRLLSFMYYHVRPCYYGILKLRSLIKEI